MQSSVEVTKLTKREAVALSVYVVHAAEYDHDRARRHETTSRPTVARRHCDVLSQCIVKSCEHAVALHCVGQISK